MRQKGSVLVVVLGLLAILAVIGVAFLTLSSLERSTAASFALQTQMMIAADGALDYAVHQMVTDVWEWRITPVVDTPGKFEFTGNLLTGRVAGATDSLNPTWIYGACETYDYPSDDDPWLSTPIVLNARPARISFEQMSATRFGIKFGKAAPEATWPDNLGFPVKPADRKANGIWIPDLAAPCDQYLVRASVTILDHNALVNLNAHGNKDTGGIEWVYDDCLGTGYFVSDVDPSALGVNLEDLLGRVGAATPGCWGSDGPGNFKAGAVLIENPAAGNDVPYTLDEEFELRNLWGTYFTSRLEKCWTGLSASPEDYKNKPLPSVPNASALLRLKATTVSWTAEVSGDAMPSIQQPNPQHKTTGGGWSAPKVDINTASAGDIYKALLDGRAWDDDDVSKTKLKQFVANLIAFRRQIGTTLNITPITVDGTDCVGAVRQPVLSEATCTGGVPDNTVPTDIKRTYTIKVEVYNPWPGDNAADLDGKFKTDTMRVTFDVNPPPAGGVAHQVLPTAYQILPASTLGDTCCPIIERQVVCHNNKTLKDALKSIRLHATMQGKVVNLDLITDDADPGNPVTNVTDLETSTTGRIYRKVWWKDEFRGSRNTRNNSAIRVFYVSNWKSDISTADLGTATKDQALETTAIPIRFPNCEQHDVTTNLPVNATGLPVGAAAGTGTDFKAFARVGDLNQVLHFQPGTTTWWAVPWICTVSRTPLSRESDVKFNWMENIIDLDTPGAVAAARAANIFCVGGPWNDDLDNDGDGKTDLDDNGLPGGPEFRIAGKINLNTAITEILTALGIPEPAKPIKSPAQVIPSSATPNGIEVRDETFARISNIATVRSDTFSVYGTVQIVDPSAAQKSDGIIQDPRDIIRTRRFWALVDRSPSLAYPPGNANYIRPRILNFQWLD